MSCYTLFRRYAFGNNSVPNGDFVGNSGNNKGPKVRLYRHRGNKSVVSDSRQADFGYRSLLRSRPTKPASYGPRP